MYYHIDADHQTILSGPHNLFDAEVKRITNCGNPECLDLGQYNLVPEWREPVEAPLGWQSPVIDQRDGVTVVAVYAAGAADDREAATQAAYLDSLECEPLQAELELIDRGLWATVSLWIDQQDAVTQAYFRRAKRWRYRDERLQAGANALGLSDAVLIEILKSARLR